MYDLQAVTSMTGEEFLSVIDPLSREELTDVLAMFWGADPAAFADALNCIDRKKQRRAEPEPERVPWPTGLCGHTVTPGAWSQGYHVCRDCVDPGARALYDRATAGEQLPQAVNR